MAQRPNILFILTDDQAAWTLGCEGHPNAYTPALDKLAAGGVRLDNLFANAAVCSPSRATLISGRYPSETGISPDGNITVIKTDMRHGLEPGLTTWPEILRDQGYRTALIGKWHMGHLHDEHHPRNRGYEIFRGWRQNGGVSRDPVMEIDGEETTFDGAYTSDVLADLTMQTIEEAGDDPFAVSLHFWAPHANHRVPDDVELPYQDRTWLPMKEEDLGPWQGRDITIPNPEFPNLDHPRIRRFTREYHASVHSVDRNVQRLVTFLRDRGQLNNTILIFTSDQGYNLAHRGLWHKGNGWWITTDRQDPTGEYGKLRDNLFDTSLRVPGIIHWPDALPPGTRVQQTLSFIDWFPTLLDMADVDPRETPPLRGRSFLPLLKQETMLWEDGFFSQHAMLRAYRAKGWKLVRDFSQHHRHELYHVAEDPLEKHNLIDSDNPLIIAVRDQLDQQIKQIMAAIEDPLRQ